MSAEARWRWAFVAYALAQLAVRSLVGPSLELDEAEALVHGQGLAWGYGPQPPIYFWLQWAFLTVLGDTVLALAALKALLLGSILVLTFELMRRVVATPAAGVATLSLSLLPQVAWESQRALTNSVMALALAVAAALLLLRMLRTGRWEDHALWGALAGLGVLAKPNFGVWAAGLLLAAWLLPDWRSRLRPVRLALAGVVALGVVAGPAAWTLENLELATGSLDKFAVAASALAARAEGSLSLLVATLSFNALGMLVLGGVWLGGRRPGARPEAAPLVRLLALAAGLSLLLVWAGVLATGATAIKDRWLMPFAWPLVPMGVVWIWPVLTDRARRALLWISGGAWIVVAAALPYASVVDPGYRGSDWTGLEAALRPEEAGPLPVVLADTWAAGNLLLRGEVSELRLLQRVEELPSTPLILVARSGTALLEDPGITARTQSTQVVDVPRGRRTQRYAVVTLAAS